MPPMIALASASDNPRPAGHSRPRPIPTISCTSRFISVLTRRRFFGGKCADMTREQDGVDFNRVFGRASGKIIGRDVTAAADAFAPVYQPTYQVSTVANAIP
jgi:hypothetical protein